MEKPGIGDKELNRDLSLELYKSLRGEVTSYLEKIPAIWLQKLTLVGAIAGFLVVNIEKFGNASEAGLLSLGAAIMAIPILAVLLDAKVVEYSLHSRAISKFIERCFDNPAVVAAWESTLWGDRGDRDVKLRSWMTVLVTTAPTILLIVLTWIALGKAYTRGVPGVYVIGLALILFFYVLGGFYIWRVIWPSKQGKEEDRR